MNCPKCKNVALEKASFEAPYSCSQCGGIWVLNEEINKLTEASFDDQQVEKTDDDDYDSKTGLCPNGHGIMIRAKMDFETPFYLERCTQCGGIWFDHGEWNQVARNHLFDNITEFWTMAWQRKHQQEKNREHFLELNKDLLGNDVFDLVLTLAEKLKDHPEKLRAVGLLKGEMS